MTEDKIDRRRGPRSPEVRAKIAAGKRGKPMSATAKANIRDGALRAGVLSKLWRNQEFRKANSARSAERMKARWADPVFREKMIARLRKYNERGSTTNVQAETAPAGV